MSCMSSSILLKIFWYRQASIILLYEFLICLLFYQFIDISIPNHDIFYQFVACNAHKSFLTVLFILKKFRQKSRNDFLLDCMLSIIAGDEPELVAHQFILDTFLCYLCKPYWVGWVVSYIGLFLVGDWAYCCVEYGRHVVTNQPFVLSSNWITCCHIVPDIFITHLEVSVCRFTVNSC